MTRRVIGADGCPTGWVTVVLENGHVRHVEVVERLDEVLAEPHDAAAIDLPIGLLDVPREADAAARGLVPGRASSVFSSPPSAVVEGVRRGTVRTHAEATALAVATTGKGLSQQAWRLVPKIVAVDALVAAGAELLEVHPEVAFAVVVGEPLPRKRSWAGLTTRRALLQRLGIVLPDRFVGDTAAAPDDVVDAAVCAWVADGAAADEPLLTIPPRTAQAARGRPVVITARQPPRPEPGPRRGRPRSDGPRALGERRYRRRMSTSRLTQTALALSVAVVLAACGDDPESTDDDAAVDDSDPDHAPDDTSDAPAEAEDDPDRDEPDTDLADPDGAEPDGAEPDEADAADDVDPDLSVELSLTEVASMSAPTAGAVGPDGTLHLAERAGTVHLLTDDGVGEAVLDISEETTTDSERGLLGLAFAADGSELYLSSTDLDGDTLISSVALDDGDIVADDRREVFTLDQPESNHNGGAIAVGPDGLLYVALGDGGGGGDPLGAGQDLTTPLGAMLRLDPLAGDPYEVPDDNPFVDDGDARPEILAYGLRNPWRFSFDRSTDELWIADVGQSAREEINRVELDDANGANFGWNLMEGTLEFEGSEPDGHVAPVYEYDTGGEEGCAITGGYVYRGEAIPELTGAYLYSDYCVGSIRAVLVEDDGEVTDQADLGLDGGQVVSFAQDVDGELYVLDLGGAVHRIDPA